MDMGGGAVSLRSSAGKQILAFIDQQYGACLDSISLGSTGSEGLVTPGAGRHSGHSSPGKVRPLDCIAAKLEIGLAAVPAEKYFQGKYLKH